MIDYYLKLSLLEGEIIKIIYQKGNEITERSIKVKRIEEDKIEAYCFLRKGIRVFKKENILSAGKSLKAEY